tara:strand:- start:1844 stop:2293 length:450 start_codon:yes stop_codon:yes gene_type:complete
MKLHFLTLFFIFSTCYCTPPQKRNADISVSYEDEVIYEVQSGWNTQADLVKASSNTEKEFYVIFSASWCSSCKILKNVINKMGWRDKVLMLNSEHKWVQELAESAGLEGIPQMFVVGPNRTDKNSIFVGASEISWELFDVFERKKKKGN